MGTRTSFVRLTAHEWVALINWVGDHTKLLPEPISNESPDSTPDKTGNNRDTESEILNDPVLPIPPPPNSLTQPISNPPPDPAPDKTGNNREIESVELNDLILSPPDSSDKPISNQPSDPTPDKTGNNRHTEFEGVNLEYTDRPIPALGDWTAQLDQRLGKNRGLRHFTYP
jgi:hypothetical protein